MCWRRFSAKVRELKPSRIIIDSMSELRMLARDSLRYRRQVLSLKQFFEGRDCTTLLLDERFGDQDGKPGADDCTWSALP